MKFFKRRKWIYICEDLGALVRSHSCIVVSDRYELVANIQMPRKVDRSVVQRHDL